MLLILIFSSIFCVLGNSWLAIWTMLELNTLSFCALMKSVSKMKAQKSSDSTMKYLLIQVIASAILLMGTSCGGFLNEMAIPVYLLATVSIMVKAAASPFHQWFINVSKKLKWAMNSVLFTWQKMAPLYLITFQVKALLAGFILMSVLSGTVSQMNKKNLKEILAYSSVFNLGWMLMAILVSAKLFFLFSLLYWASLLMFLSFVIKMKIENIEETASKVKPWVVLTLMASLAGIPPLMGFMAKWGVFSFALNPGSGVLVTLMLVISTIGFYVYLRTISGSVIKSTPTYQKMSKPVGPLWLFLFSNVSAMLSVSL